MKNVRIIRNNDGTPHGIRDNNGFLLFFPNINRYPEQEDRYNEEIADQKYLAGYILGKLLTFNYEWHK